jgi:hypothetical protein
MVPKRRHSKIRRRGYTQKTTHNIQNMAKVWNQEKYIIFTCILFTDDVRSSDRNYTWSVININEQLIGTIKKRLQSNKRSSHWLKDQNHKNKRFVRITGSGMRDEFVAYRKRSNSDTKLATVNKILYEKHRMKRHLMPPHRHLPMKYFTLYFR